MRNGEEEPSTYQKIFLVYKKFPEFANRGNNDADFQLGIVGPMLGFQKNEEQAEIDCRHDSIMMEKHMAHSAQENQGRKMIQTSEQRFAPIDVGQNVLMPIPCVYRPKIEPRNLMGVVTAPASLYGIKSTENQWIPVTDELLLGQHRSLGAKVTLIACA
ncbi:unnamed protein product, partial [Mesorhabditis belari]|uniref:Uncharacterized protein n=1 Tax=Mesorhabditis belari TaxID=2138241 RepID=A0AAF3EP05_9BILA